MIRKAIPGHPGYEADSAGNIWSVASNWRGYGKRILTAKIWRDEYVVVTVGRSLYTVHGLVCRAFHGPKPRGKQVRHLDGVRANNRPENLQWGTAKENADDRRRHGRTRYGTRLPWAKLDPAAVRGIRHWLGQGREQQDVADLYGIHPSTVSQIKRQVTWREVP